MARKPRTHYLNATYHVTLRGNYQQTIFHSNEERLFFYDLLDQATQKYACQFHAFCLMDNHVHLLVEVCHIPLAKIMQSICAQYAKKKNRLLNRVGHLFQGRYKAALVHNEKYLLELCYYIHHNPVRAAMVKEVDQYPWSSHHVYTGKVDLEWVTTQYIKDMLSRRVSPPGDPKRQYENFIRDRKRAQQTPQFCRIDEQGALLIADDINKKTNDKLFQFASLPLGAMIRVICDYMGVSQEQVTSEGKDRLPTLARSMITYFAHYHSGFYLTNIAQVLNREAISLSRTLHRTLQQMSKDKKVFQLVDSLHRELLKESLSVAMGFSAKDRARGHTS